MNSMELIRAWSSMLRCSEQEVVKLIVSAPYRYRHYQIPKRTGGMRDIYHPTPELKAVQRWLNTNMFGMLPIHDSVCSYRVGMGVKAHAKRHLNANYVLRLDFKDFFPSINIEWLENFFVAQSAAGLMPCDSGAANLMAWMACRRGKKGGATALSIGAPSSPVISNAILYEFDLAAFDFCSANDCEYSRYADDIYISSRAPNVIGAIEVEVRRLVSEKLPLLALNQDKTINTSRKRRIIVTGLNITSDRKISIGRELKREIKTQIYLWSVGRLDVLDANRLKGLLSYVKDVEPSFLESLEAKFGVDLIEKLTSSKPSVDEIPF